MKNISFDNPYLLLLAIPLILVIVIPYVISVNKDNKSIGWKISLGLHVVISLLVTLAIAGLMSVTVLTKTTVYVVADVSYSSDRNLDEIDGYIAQIKENLPVNSKLGVVCFGKNSAVLTPAGRALKSVSESKVDDSATDIVSALDYTETLFDDGTIKRIVLITDGNDTVNRSTGSLAATVERLTDNGIKVDAVYLNNALKDNEVEVQLSDVEFTPSTYTGHESSAKFLLQASAKTNAVVELYSREKVTAGVEEKEYTLLEKTVVSVDSGFNTVSMSLPTDKAGNFEYKVTVTAENDHSPYNNERTFVQSVVGKMQILLITGNSEDVALIEEVYGEDSEISSYIIGMGNDSVPFMLQELAVYDEIIISNVDIREIRNVNAFVNSLDIVVSQFGKSLITFGDLGLQDEIEDPILVKFQELLPVNYGNGARDGKLYTIVLDVSHSMSFAYKLRDACDVAIKLISLLNDEDNLCLVTFSGVPDIKKPKPVKECKQEIIAHIEKIAADMDTSHGTDIGRGLEEALNAVNDLNLAENQVMVISDGMSFDSTVDSIEVATELFSKGVPVSAITIYTPSDEGNGITNMKNIVNCGEGGIYAEIRAGSEPTSDVVFGTVADNVTEAVITDESSVNIVGYKDGIVEGISSLPNVSGYIQSVTKYDATAVLTVNYVKHSGYNTTVPLYAYRPHGNGRACSFTSDLSGDWTAKWSDELKAEFIRNLIVSNTPKENLDNPFTVSVVNNGFDSYVEVVPSIIDPESAAKVAITLPSGRRYKRDLSFDSQKYFYSFESTEVGSYNIQVTYEYLGEEYVSEVNFEIPYLPEYDAFTAFDKASVYEFMRNYGSITEGEIPGLENDENEISTYKVSYSIPLLIAAIALFLIDILIRKLRISDIKAKKKLKEQKKGERAA